MTRLFAGGLLLAFASQSGFSQDGSGASANSSSIVEKTLPRWLRMNVELHGRAEASRTFDTERSEGVYLNRLRLNVRFEPKSWATFVFQGQDAQALGFYGNAVTDDRRNSLDIRLGYARFGHSEEGWSFQVGRQELAVADERLLGADTYWDVFGQSFDAVRGSFATGSLRAEAFAGYRVDPSDRRPDRLDRSSRIAGITVDTKTKFGSLVPYVLWKRGGETFNLAGLAGHRDVVTPGFRALGDLPGNLDYNIEMAVQGGHVTVDSISAWAGHWEAGWKPIARDAGPRIAAEYNFASGDRNRADGRHRTFDDLYPAGFNKFGMEDPIAWRNVRYPAVAVELPITKRWAAGAGARAYWLDTVLDGLYTGGDEFFVRNPAASSSHVGNQWFISTAYNHSDHVQIAGGYGQLYTGAYLRQSGYARSLNCVYLLGLFSF